MPRTREIRRLHRDCLLLRPPSRNALPRRRRRALQHVLKSPRPGSRSLLAALLVAAAAGGCGGGGGSHSRTASASTRPVSATTQGCNVTLPNHSIPPGQEHNPGHERAPYLGNGKLWTVLWPHGVFVARRHDVARDGSISIKSPWWRGVRGALKLTGRRLDKPASPLRADIGPGYGSIGFQATGIIFSTPGCWQVTGSVGKARLTFVMLVRKPPRR